MIETGGVLIYVREEIPAKQQMRYKTQADVESCFLKLNLYRKKWLLSGLPLYDTYKIKGWL